MPQYIIETARGYKSICKCCAGNCLKIWLRAIACLKYTATANEIAHDMTYEITMLDFKDAPSLGIHYSWWL